MFRLFLVFSLSLFTREMLMFEMYWYCISLFEVNTLFFFCLFPSFWDGGGGGCNSNLKTKVLVKSTLLIRRMM